MEDSSSTVRVFAGNPHSTLTLPGSEREYTAHVQSLGDALKANSAAFTRPEYLGHMNYDVSRPHWDGLRMALPHNSNQVAFESSPQTSLYEQAFIQQMQRMVGFPIGAWGYATTGGTLSNLEALWIARNVRRGPVRVLCTPHSHYSIKKVCNILGLECVELPRWPDTDAEWDLALSGALAVVATLGTTEMGQVDPLDRILPACRRHGVWVHADAAYGGYFVLASPDLFAKPDTHAQLQRMAECDSVAIDPHKQGYAPYGIGVFLLRNGALRSAVHSTHGIRYIDTQINSSCTVEGSRNGALVTSAYFGHQQMLPLYPRILNALLQRATQLKRALAEDARLDVHPNTDMGMVLWRLLPAADRPPMAYYVRRFTGNENAREKGRLTLVTTVPRCAHDNPEGHVFFRACLFDPELDVARFVAQFQEELQLYTAEYECWVQERVDILTSFTVEQDLAPLREMVASCEDYTCYNGFEPSNRSMTFAQGMITVLNTQMMLMAGCNRMTLYIADRFAQLNHKYGGDLDKIRAAGRFYIELFNMLGLTEAVAQGKVNYVWASDLLNTPAYWNRVMDMSCQVTLNRVKKCTQIMGRENAETLYASQILYPIMQACDVYELGVDCTEMGLDQRKVNMLVNELADKHRPGKRKPVILSHKMLSSLKGKAKGGKMSKSDPRGAIFIDDAPEAVRTKVMGAFCPDTVEDNPIWDYLEAIIFRWASLNQQLPLELCGRTFTGISAAEAAPDGEATLLTPNVFAALDKGQLKTGVAFYVNRILAPVHAALQDPDSPVYVLYNLLSTA